MPSANVFVNGLRRICAVDMRAPMVPRENCDFSMMHYEAGDAHKSAGIRTDLNLLVENQFNPE
jgi:hypothetical protein